MRPCRRRRLCTRHSSNTTARTHSDMAPFFSTSNRPWDVKEPLRAYPQYRPASSSLGSGLRGSRTLLRVIYSLTLPVPCDPAGSSPFRSGEAKREPLLVWPRGMRFSKCTYPLPIPLHSASSEPAQGPTTSIPRCLASRSALGFLAVAASRPLTPSVPSDPVHEEELLHTALHRSRPRCATPGVCRAWWGARSSDGNRREQAWEAGCGHGHACVYTLRFNPLTVRAVAAPWITQRDFVDIQFPNPVSSVGNAIWRPQSPSFSFGASQRQPWIAKTPGPGEPTSPVQPWYCRCWSQRRLPCVARPDL